MSEKRYFSGKTEIREHKSSVNATSTGNVGVSGCRATTFLAAQIEIETKRKGKI